MSELSKLLESRSPVANPANLANPPPEISRISNFSRGANPNTHLVHHNKLRVLAGPSVRSVDMLARELLRKRRSELQKHAADDWGEISADPGKLIAFASLEAIRQIRESGAIPDTYTAKTLCAGCQAEVPIFAGCPPRVISCVWCLNGLVAPPIPGVDR